MSSSGNIHSSAIIHPGAEIGSNVTIGPFCVIHDGVVIGDDSVLESHVVIAGPTRLGKNNRFFPFSSIGQITQDLKYAGEPTYLVIGDNNTFREFTTVNRGTAPGSRTLIGSDNLFLSYAHIAHDCVVGNHVIFSNNGTLAGHVTVEDHAILGGLSAVHQFCRIGSHAITGGCTKVVQDVPPFMIADGNPAAVRGINQVGLERRGFSPETIRELREAFRLLYRAQLNTTQAVEKMKENLLDSGPVSQLVAFIESSSRGIIR